jgi:hypothetical protein
MRRWFTLGVVAGLLAFGAGCATHRIRPGEARLVVDGRTLAAEVGQELRPAKSGAVLHRGARVVVEEGKASLLLAAAQTLELRAGSRLLVGITSVLDAGDALVTSGHDAAMLDAGEGALVAISGVAHVTRSFSVSVATYRGYAALRSAGREVSIKAPRQATVAGLGLLPGKATPITYAPTDTWDRRYLGAAIELGDALTNPIVPFTQALRPGEGMTPGFYRLLLPALDRQSDFGPALLDPARSPGETLVGAEITIAGRDGTFGERWNNVFSFRSEGAHWGLVALDQSVSQASGIVRNLTDALNRASLNFASPGARTTTSSTTPAPGPGGGGPSTTTSTTQPTTPPTTPTTQPPVTIPPTGTPLDPIVQPVVKPIVDTINGLLARKP